MDESLFDTSKQVFKERLANLLCGATVVQFASECGITRQALTNYLHGENFPDVRQLIAICIAKNVSADYLLGLSEGPAFMINKVMTLDEVLSACDVILELRPDECDSMEWMLVSVPFTEPDRKGNVWFKLDGDNGRICMSKYTYGTRWRCWRYDHIIRQMKKTPWETDPSEEDGGK